MFTENSVRTLLGNIRGKKIAVLGDLMIDRYYWGAVNRISPEAPVPVLEVESESVRFGGAANVANNIQSLGGVPVLVGLIGNDHPGELLIEMLKEQGFTQDGIVVDGDRPTTIKTRVIAHDQHVVRIDYESKSDCPDHLIPRIVDAVRYNIHSLDGIIIEDYNKGVVTKEIIHQVIEVAKKYNKIVTVDPKHHNFFEYKGVTVFKPNKKETEDAVGFKLNTEADVLRAGKKMLEDLNAENVLLTRSGDGMSLFESSGRITHIPMMAENVQDVSGAGDTVISTLTMALASGADIRDACTLANVAGGVVVGHVGIVPITPADLQAAALHHAGEKA